MTNKIEDGWHLFLGYRVWVEKNRVKYADAGKYGFGYLYRRVCRRWVQIDSVSGYKVADIDDDWSIIKTK